MKRNSKVGLLFHLVRALTNLHRFDNSYRFSTWLFTIAKRLHLNAAQKRAPAFDTDTVGQVAQSRPHQAAGDPEAAERTLELDLEVPDEPGDDALILEEAPPEGTVIQTLEIPPEARAEDAPRVEELQRELVALRLELARSQSTRESLEEQLAELSDAPAREETPSPPYSPEELAALRLRAEAAEREQARLEAEIHDLERLLESETWRGLATHRDLVRAHQRLRQVEQELASSTARVIDLAERLELIRDAVPAGIDRTHHLAEPLPLAQ